MEIEERFTVVHILALTTFVVSRSSLLDLQSQEMHTHRLVVYSIAHAQLMSVLRVVET